MSMEFKQLEKEIEEQLKQVKPENDLVRKEMQQQLIQVKAVQANISKIKEDPEHEQILRDLENEIRHQLEEIKTIHTESEFILAETKKEVQKQLDMLSIEPVDMPIVSETKKEVQKQLDMLSVQPVEKQDMPIVSETEKKVQPQLNMLIQPDQKQEDNTDTEENTVTGTWGQTIMNDLKTGNHPDWLKFLDKFVPPSIKAAMAVLETTQAITDNKDAIIDTGKLYIDVKLKQNKKALEKEALALETDDTNKTGGAFTYEDCVF